MAQQEWHASYIAKNQTGIGEFISLGLAFPRTVALLLFRSGMEFCLDFFFVSPLKRGARKSSKSLNFNASVLDVFLSKEYKANGIIGPLDISFSNFPSMVVSERLMCMGN